MSEKRNIKYLGKDFSELKQNLYTYIKSYFPDVYGDFTEGTAGELLIDNAAYVGDILNYYLDYQFNELLDPQERKNVITMAQKIFGYTPKVVTPSRVSASIGFIIPATGSLGEEEIDTDYLPILRAGAILETKGISPSVQFVTIEDINFYAATASNYTPFEYSGSQIVSYYTERGVEAISGKENSYIYTITTPQKYLKIQLPSTNISDIVSVIDADGYAWYEVPSLATDVIYYEDYTVDSTTRSAIAILKKRQVERRFSIEVDENNYTYLCFGAGTEADNDEDFILNPDNIDKNWFDKDASINPENFLKTKTFGKAPSSNLTVTYRTNNGHESNIPSKTLKTVISRDVLFSKTGLDASKMNSVIASISCNNNWPAFGGKGRDTIEEIKEYSKNNFLAQNRCVTKTDYESRIMNMPSKYGKIYKTRVIKNTKLDTNEIFVYLLAKDNNDKLAQCNATIKNNIKTYLSDYRLLTDKVILKDGNILNLRVTFRIIAEPNYQKNEVLARCINVLKNYFYTDKRFFGEKIIKSQLYKELTKEPGVQSVVDITFETMISSGYSNYFIDIESLYNSNTGIYYVPDNCVYEIKYPNRDIIGQASGIE